MEQTTNYGFNKPNGTDLVTDDKFWKENWDKTDTTFKGIDSQLAETAKYRTDLILQGNSVKFTAHRGAQQVAPENSIPAFQTAGKAGFWGLETDTSPTSDGVWVIMHDDSVDRTTDGTGEISALTLAQIKALKIDVGSNVGFYPNLRVPTLEEFLIVCRNYNTVPEIELKGTTTDVNFDSLVNLIKKYGFETKCIINSAYFESLQAIRNRSSLISLQYVTNILYTTTIQDAINVGCSTLAVDYSALTQQVIDEIHNAAGLKVRAWVINDYGLAKQFVDMGVDYITTDNIVDLEWL